MRMRKVKWATDYLPTANCLVKEILNNTKNGKKIEWLTNRKAAFRFITSMFNKRDFFNDK